MPAGRGARHKRGHTGRHHRRRRKGQANRDPARRYSLIPGGLPRKAEGSKMLVGLAGGHGGGLKFRGKETDTLNPRPVKFGRRHPKGRNRSGRGAR